MSIRGDAKVLGISDSYLSRLLSGKRRWTPELYENYLQLQIGNFGSTLNRNLPKISYKFGSNSPCQVDGLRIRFRRCPPLGGAPKEETL